MSLYDDTPPPSPRGAWDSSDDLHVTLADAEHVDLLHRALSTLTLKKRAKVSAHTLRSFLELSEGRAGTLHATYRGAAQRGAGKLYGNGAVTPAARKLHYSQTLPRNHKVKAQLSRQDDADSGYHTGSSTLQSRGPKGSGAPTRRVPTAAGPTPPGDGSLSYEELRRRIEDFNNNNHGLIMSLQQDTNTFQGFIRVHMNLIRPINMSLSTRPTSIYDVIGQGEEEEAGQPTNEATQVTSFYLPKDTTKVIHINSDTTTQEVIKALLSKFKITDNPRKFALYEKICDPTVKATMRRMDDEECPLPLCLCWTTNGVEGLDLRKFVLQENDTGEIMWEAFSLPELENFLRILNREEEEYVEQVREKYRMLKIHMTRRSAELSTDGKPRKPVFV